MTKRELSFFSVAKKVSALSNFKNGRIQIGCVVVDGNRIVSSGYNSEKTSTVQKRYDRYRFLDDTPHKVHAEIHALTPLLRNSEIDFHKLKLFIYREHKDGSLAKSRPCKSCMELIKHLGIRYIYYTTDDGYCEEIVDSSH